MHHLIDELVDVLQAGFDSGLEDTRKTADVVVDAITTYLFERNDAFGGALTPAIELLSLEAEAARLRRIR
jgi:hypothetical protein